MRKNETIPQLDYPVFTLDQRELLPAGAFLSDDVMRKVITSNEDPPYEETSFLEYGNVKKDLFEIFNNHPYDTLFKTPEKTIALDMLREIRFIAPILKFLDYFKEHDLYTYRHTLAVFALSAILAYDLFGRSEDWIDEAMAGTIHDFGKICVPLDILRETNPLSRTDRKILEHHSLAGYVLLSYYMRNHRSFAAKVAKKHHERKDGSGYPLGILQNDKMVEIVAASDVYDALLSPRPYRPKGFDNRTALEEMTIMALDGKLSWELVQVLVSHNREQRPSYLECDISRERRGRSPEKNNYGVYKNETE
ncbi:MAG: HD domain-containing protein [Candidatus Aminicenantes bacterium]|nr:HD domain-containing protein [Candidatus Aminicenantes bacterium]